ncbi:NlpC/P60 family protein [Streptomyces sp. H10-C2]|nr:MULTISPECIES: NlpC/P60 family protein [unclassified Streptomyces]MDJ0340568.1 NlpC/P60 family protein [Streptomyces sp. PH10-H1]MDJ0370216.1 NlpC/P60 family protein [Streptomyces sp. H10-C2]
MASHRKPRTRILASTGPRAVVGLTAAALATVTLMSESASAAPAKPSITEVKAQIDDLRGKAEVATEHANAAKEKTDQQRAKADLLLAEVAKKTQKLNDARRVLGQFAAAQYRNGGVDQTTALLLSDNPEKFLEQSHLVDRMSATQEDAIKEFRTQQAESTAEGAKAGASLAELTASQTTLDREKKNVQAKLADAQKLLNSLSADERKKVAQLDTAQSGSSNSATYTYNGPASGRAAAAIDFALAQRGKPYVSGATGPGSYDCSGLTQAAYRSAGISISRTTYTQINDGTRVSQSELRPGDLVFFYSGISHVAIYLGNDEIVHAPHPGGVVEVGKMSWMPFAGAVRLA